jgi:alkylation response protein AidB-like acyl-CoA dehydrogenase
VSLDLREPASASLDSVDWLGTARDLAPMIEATGEATEASGTLLPQINALFRETGLHWMLLPCELGGAGANFVTFVEVVEELSRADASTGWSFMANALSSGIAGAFLAEEGVQAMFGEGRKSIGAGMLGPGGKAVEVDGGYRGSGRYSFGSGSAHADWFGAGMLVMENGKPRELPSGMPEVRVCFVPKDKVRLLGNWDVMGLVGTGSFDYELPEQFIPRAFTMERTAILPLRGGPQYALGIGGMGCAGHAGVILGLMKRSLQEVARIGRGKKRPGYPSVVADHAVFLHEFGMQEAAYQSVRSYILQVFRDAQDTALRGETIRAEQRARIRQATTWGHRVAMDVVRFCFQWSGQEGLRNPSDLGRCMRDMLVANQHVFVDPITVVDAARPILEAWAPSVASP